MSAVAAAPKAKPVRRPVWFRVRRLVDPATGEEVGALVPVHHSDRDAMRARGFTVGTELRAELKKRRNPKFYRLAHALALQVTDGVMLYGWTACGDDADHFFRGPTPSWARGMRRVCEVGAHTLVASQ